MPHRAFFAFLMPSLLAMVLFILLPLISVGYQSLFSPPRDIEVLSEICSTNFLTGVRSCEQTVTIEKVEGPKIFRGLDFFCGRSVLACGELATGWSENKGGMGEYWSKVVLNLPLYKAMTFTMFYTLITTPFIIVLGLVVALVVDNLWRPLRGPTIFASLLPFIVTPLVGSLVLFWMTDNTGGLLYTLTNTLAFWADDFSLRASPQATWSVIAVYGIWHVTPFAFVVFYAGLQTVSQDQFEAAMIDGAPRFDRLRYVILPHLMPLITFVLLIHIMDAFRVLEPIFGFQAAANAQSVSYLIYEHLVLQADKRYGSAAATSVLTIVMVFILLLPVLIRTWRDFRVAAR